MRCTFLLSSGLDKCKNSSKGDKIMKLGRMVRIDYMNKFSPVAKMIYGYVGQRSRSKSAKVKKGYIEKKSIHCMFGIKANIFTYAIHLDML